MDNLWFYRRKGSKPSRSKTSSFRGELQRFYSSVNDSDRMESISSLIHSNGISTVAEENQPGQFEKSVPKTNFKRSSSMFASAPQTTFFCQTEISYDESQNKVASANRLKSSNSAASYKEMKKTVRKNDLSHQRHNSEPQVQQTYLLQCTSSPQGGTETNNNPLALNLEAGGKQSASEATVEDCFPVQDLIVALPSDHETELTSISEISSFESDVNHVVLPAVETISEATEAKDGNISKRSQSFVNSYPICKDCGQKHRVAENHEYDYVEDADDDFLCDVCLQPFVEPYDTRCGHTFCCVCLKNYVRLKKACPIDRTDIRFIPSDCWQSSLVLRRLVDKMVVNCPYSTHCQMSMPRANLSAHLKERCPGAIIRCKYAMFGCSYKGPRIQENEHIAKCKFQNLQGNPIDLLYPNHEKHVVELFRPEGNAELGLRIVGGNDTPLSNIIVQNVLAGSLIHSDGRIQSGDIIIDVNGEDLHSASHVEARAALCRNARLMRFTLLRDKALSPADNFVAENETSTETIVVSIVKPPTEQLGIKLASYDDRVAGVYVDDILPGKVVHASGLLRIGDRILKIANVDITNGNSEIAARIIQGASEKFDIVISRRIPETETLTAIANPWACDATMPKNSIKATECADAKGTTTSSIPFPDVIPMLTSQKKKAIHISKEPFESLGIVVSGGSDCIFGNLPVFVQDIQPLGVLDRDKRIKRGDLLLEINGIRLHGLTHGQAVSTLKGVTSNCENITLIVLELVYSGKEEDFALLEELGGVHHQRAGPEMAKNQNTWHPSWKLWLAVPSKYKIPHNVIIKKNVWGEFGFCIVGGRSENDESDLPLLVKYVTPGSPAEVQGRLRCGDEIMAINGYRLNGMTHLQVVETLKQSASCLKLTVMSWPGSSH